MQKFRLGFAGLCVFALLLSVTVLRAAQKDASFAGSWEMAMTSGGQGGGQDGDQGSGGGNRGGRGGAQSLTITQDGDKFKVSHKTRHGENAYDAVVSGNTISWTEDRTTPDGKSRKIAYEAKLSGDTMTGTMGGMGGGKFSREFTAKRSPQN